MTIEEKLVILDQVFSPSAPIETRELFIGRLEQIRDVHSAVLERGQHAILYGERGVGKTSLANIIASILPDITCVKVTCNRTETFKKLWEKALRKVEFHSRQSGLGYTAKEKVNSQQLSLFLPQHDDIDSTDLENIFENLRANLLFIFDEFDSINSKKARTRFADTIKALSDNCPHVSILLVGIGESVTELIGDHQSLERCLKQVKMPRMSDDELEGIIENGCDRMNLKITTTVKGKIIEYSAGFPHYTHLIAKYAARNTIISEKQTIELEDFDFSVREVIKNANQQIRDSYQMAVITSKGVSQFKSVVSAIALAEIDDYACSSTNQILKKFNEITGKDVQSSAITYNLGMLCKEERGTLLEKIGTKRNIKYRFKNPLMKAYIKLILHDEEIDE